MSTARLVPETFAAQTDGPLTVLRTASWRRVAADAVARMRFADGFSHSRAMAFQVVLTIVPASIAFVALASVLDWDTMSQAVDRAAEAVAPGTTSDVFHEAFQQGAGRGGSAWTALAAGFIGAMVAGTTAYGQLERTANRLYGVEADRPTARKYGLALAMCAGTVVLVGIALGLAGLLGDWEHRHSGVAARLARSVTWPLGGVALLVAFVVVFSVSPRRRQPHRDWLVAGALVSMVSVVVVSGALSLYLGASGSFGDTYGPLAGLIGVLLWAYGLSLSVFLGVAVSAQLEAVRAGAAAPRDDVKLLRGDPEVVR
jgi:YihY family inner membrane protein